MAIEQISLPPADRTGATSAPGRTQGPADKPAIQIGGSVTAKLSLDLIERAIVLALFGYFVYRMLSPLTRLIRYDIAYPELLIQAAASNIGAILLVGSEVLSVALILARRRSADMSSNPLDWILSFVAVNAPLLATPAAAGTLVPAQFGAALMLAGMAIQIAAKASLWRSFGIVPANRGVRTGGLYRIVRHPMYAGYAVTHIGFLLGYPSLQNALLYVTALAIQIVRLMREERILNRDPTYRHYAAQVRYRLLPRLF